MKDDKRTIKDERRLSKSERRGKRLWKEGREVRRRAGEGRGLLGRFSDEIRARRAEKRSKGRYKI